MPIYVTMAEYIHRTVMGCGGGGGGLGPGRDCCRGGGRGPDANIVPVAVAVAAAFCQHYASCVRIIWPLLLYRVIMIVCLSMRGVDYFLRGISCGWPRSYYVDPVPTCP